jgi:hypothetical protein
MRSGGLQFAGSWSGESSTRGVGRRRAADIGALKASRRQFRVPPQGQPGGVVLTYRASRRGAVTFVVEGPGPSCTRLGELRARARAGVNRLRFRGRVGHRVLAPGTYRIRQRLSASGVLVTVLPRRGSRTFDRTAPQCGPALAVMAPSRAIPHFVKLTASVSSVPVSALAASPSAGETASRDRSGSTDRSRPERVARAAKGVLGAISPQQLAPLQASRDELPTLLGLVALAVLLLAAIAIVAYVIHFILHTPKEA